MLFPSTLVSGAFAKAFAPIPPEPIWEWADRNVWLAGNEAAEPGPYRSAKTPWARSIQTLMGTPWHHIYDWSGERWITVALKEINVMKSSQSGFTEAVLNAIRFSAQYRPKNVIYTVDTRETARDISNRLLPSLQKLDGADIFTGDDHDLGTFVMRLRAMDIWFQGSFSMGKFASKMAPIVVSDESEEQGSDKTDTSTDTALKSRKKTADSGLFVSICKPKRRRGPIHRGFLRGDQQAFMVRCPACAYWQPLTFWRNQDQAEPLESAFAEPADLDAPPTPLARGTTRTLITGRLVFEHCKDLLGNWDKLRVSRETYYECGNCRAAIEEFQKPALLASARWIPTAHGDPGVVSQHINDLYSTDANSAWGALVLDYLARIREGRRELQGFFNHALGLPWSDEVNKTSDRDILTNIAGHSIYRIDSPGEGGYTTRKIFTTEAAATAAAAGLTAKGLTPVIVPSICPPYQRGTIPVSGCTLILGSDVGGNYAKWVVGAVLPNMEDIAIVDWGTELDPDAVAEIFLTSTWLCPPNGKKYGASAGFMDAKFRKGDCYSACLRTHRRLMPCAGLGGTAARSVRLFSATQVQQYPSGFLRLDFNDREAKDELYIARLKKKNRRVWFPHDVAQDPDYIAESSAEELLENDRGQTYWNEHPGANHYGDCNKLLVVGTRYLTRRMAHPRNQK
jgi:hypothetical protein